MSQCNVCNSYCSPTIVCQKCKVFWYCGEQCHSPSFFLNYKHTKCQADPKARQKLRYKKDDTVYARVSIDKWEEGVICETWLSERSLYSVRVSSGALIKIKLDSNADIRLKDFNSNDFEALFFSHVKWGCRVSVMSEIVRKNSSVLKWLELTPKLYPFAARHGNLWALLFVVDHYQYDPYSVDEKGRNLFHWVLMYKMDLILYHLLTMNTFDKWIDMKKLLAHCDNDGRSCLHYTVMFNDLMLPNYIMAELTDRFTAEEVHKLCGRRDNKGLTALDYAFATKKIHACEALMEPTMCELLRQFEEETDCQRKFVDEEFYLTQLKKHLTVKALKRPHLGLAIANKFSMIELHCHLFGFLRCFRWLRDESGWMLSQIFSPLVARALQNCASGTGYSCFIELYHCKGVHQKYTELMNNELKRKLLSLFADLCQAEQHSDFTCDGMIDLLDRLADYNCPIVMNDITTPIRPTYDLNKLQSQLLSPLPSETENLFQMFLFERHHVLKGTLTEERIETIKYLLPKYTGNGSHDELRISMMVKAAEHGQCGILKWLVEEHNIDLNTPLKNHDTGSTTNWELLISMAAMRDHVETVVYLLTLVPDAHLLRFGGKYNTMFMSAGDGGFRMLMLYLKNNWSTDADLMDVLESCVQRETANVYAASHILEYFGQKKLASQVFKVNVEFVSYYYAMTSSVLTNATWFRAATKMQRIVRRFTVYKRYKHYFGNNLPLYLMFKKHWGVVVKELYAPHTQLPKVQSRFSWLALKKQFDFVVPGSGERSAESEGVITALTASAAALEVDTEHAQQVSSVEDRITTPLLEAEVKEAAGEIVYQKPLHDIELSQHVLKWLHSADSRYRAMFHKKVTLLADGYRSYALSKALQGCRYPIYETKLDDGQRILWTKVQRAIVSSIMVWFVSKHDKVPHYLSLIDNSASRLAKMPSTSSTDSLNLSESVSSPELFLQLSESEVLLDPAGNCPLKVYQTNRHELQNCVDGAGGATWVPPLRLSSKQQSVNEESGTVLLLGRSGTGKTICLCDRMTRDRNRSASPIRQLFVCRSKRLCEFVKSYQEQHCDTECSQNISFLTLSSFTTQMSDTVTADHGSSTVRFDGARYIDFKRFAAVVFPNIQRKCSVAVTVVWLHIRSFLKGSVEAVMQGKPLTLEQYLDLSVFGMDRSRLSVENRREVYAVFVRYEDALKAQGLWDDADYTLDLLNRSKLQPLSTQYDKVYVDEVQDNTQAEIVLFFLAAGMNTQSLFLAGDPAQSVVEGVDFRFEEVRSIVYKLSSGKQSIHRPMKLTVNYRSHSGVLNCAAAVLDKMFAMFPGAANVLPKDVGLFQGPRPACCQVAGMNGLAKLLLHNQRLVVLCVDEEVEQVESVLSQQGVVNVVLGIRAAKGLEFTDVVLVDFFHNLPMNDHSVWKGLFSDNTPTTAEATHPHVEGQLKLLYTAVTRSCNRLLFVETTATPLSSSVFRWLVNSTVAEVHVTNSDDHNELMTSDEWRAQGIEFALSAEGVVSEAMLDRALKCFTLASDSVLSNFAKVQLSIVKCSQSFKGDITALGSSPVAAEEQLSKDVMRRMSDVMLSGVKCHMYSECAALSSQLLTYSRQLEYSHIFKFEVFDILNKLCAKL